MDDHLRILGGAHVPGESGGPDLVVRAASGDTDAFEALVRAYERRVYGFALRYLRDPHEAADLAQEIFLRLFRKLDRFDSTRPFEPWFWKLAARVSADYLDRLTSARREVPLHDAALDRHATLDAAPGRETALGSALSRLPVSYRLPLLLHYELGLSLQEVADITRSTVSAVKSRLHRARLDLQRELRRELP